MLLRYPSIAALADDYRLKVLRNVKPDANNKEAWYNNESESKSLALSYSGDTNLVPDAERLLSSLDFSIETPRLMWERNVAGAFCSVPDVLAGLPTPMRRLRHKLDELAPITILATTTSSAGITSDVLARRGAVILALVMALSRIRPVSLQQLTILNGRDASGETIITSEINTTPLDLASACYVLTSSGFARRLTYNLGRVVNGFDGHWPRKFDYKSPERYYNTLIPKLVPDPKKCLLIGAAKSGDLLLTDPMRWIENEINRFVSNQEEEIFA